MISKAKISIVLTLFLLAPPLWGTVNVVTTTTNAAALIKAVGGPHVSVVSLTSGSQDPHYLEAKPSYIMEISQADLLVSIGLELEVGWLPAVLRGARNQAVMPGSKGSLILGNHIVPLEIPKGPISRDQGDIHPDGNPHFMLDPIRAASLASVVAESLGNLDPENQVTYKNNAANFAQELAKRTKNWQAKIKSSNQSQIITQHKTLHYFLTRMGVNAIAHIEPNPGVPPTAGHILALIKLVQEKKISLLLVENYYDTAAAKRIQSDAKSVNVVEVPVSVDGQPGITTLVDLYESLVAAITTNSPGMRHDH